MYCDCTKPGRGPQEIDPGEVADVIHDRWMRRRPLACPVRWNGWPLHAVRAVLTKAGTTLGAPGSARRQAAIPAASCRSDRRLSARVICAG
jgi:hypothetical protein